MFLIDFSVYFSTCDFLIKLFNVEIIILLPAGGL